MTETPIYASSELHTLRSQVRALIGSRKIAECRTLDISYTLRDTVFIYLVLGGAVGGVCFLHLLWGPFALAAAPVFALLAGVGFNWINVQIHEASHRLLLPNGRWNDLYCDFVLGALGFQDVETYRATHYLHHAHLHTSHDPDLWVYTSNVGSARQVALGILDDLFLRTICRRKRQVDEFIRVTGISRTTTPYYIVCAKVLMQFFVLGVFIWGCGIWGPMYYLSVYVYGLVGIFPVLVRVRTVVQHFDPSIQTLSTVSPRFISRSTVATMTESMVVGARMDYHFEHHLYPNLPYYGLKQMHRALLASGFFDLDRPMAGRIFHTNDYLRTYFKLSGLGT